MTLNTFSDYKYEILTNEDRHFDNSNGSLPCKDKGYAMELIVSKGRRKKRTCIIISVILALIVLALIIAAIVLLRSPKKEYLGLPKTDSLISLEDVIDGKLNPTGFNATWISARKSTITFDEFVNDKLVPKKSNGTWMKGGKLLYRNNAGDLMVYDVKKRSAQTLLSVNNSILEFAVDFELSPDQKYLMVSHEYHKLYRHSYVARYSIINLENFKLTHINVKGEVILQYATWGPIGNAVVFVLLNNIYYMASVDSPVREITSDGQLHTIHNGIPDWVYEEEVLSSNRAVWFSPDGKRMAYAKFNDSRVGYMNIPVYGQPGELQFQYTKALQIRYPKPGTDNPIASLLVVDLETLETKKLESPDSLKKDAILATVSWATNTIVSAIWMNRVQNEAFFIGYDTDALSFEIIHHFKQPIGWTQLFTAPIFSKDGSKAVFIWSHVQKNNAGAYRHVTLIERKPNAALQPLTSGLFVVEEILSWNEDKNTIYYQANSEEDPALEHVYSVDVKSLQTKCLSCGMFTSLEKSKCLHNSAKFSVEFEFYILNCGGPGVPEMSIIKTDTNQRQEIWESNSKLVDLLKEKAVPTIKRFTVPIADGFQAQVSLRLPPNLETNGNVKYPMLVNVYGGPDSNQIGEKFNIDWGSYLAANKSIIYAAIDGRGSGMKGDKMLFAGFRQLGTVEIVDQINVTRQIQQMLPYVDATRTGIWGWSYGGYASAMALAQDKEGVFKCGISVAPVTDWALYDSIYTERFMGLPSVSDNLQGYKNAQLLDKYEGLRDKKYFLVHGTLDDNVHYQQSMLWSKVLEQNDILFRQQSYPDEDHGLASVRPHLYHSLENFLDECFVIE